MRWREPVSLCVHHCHPPPFHMCRAVSQRLTYEANAHAAKPGAANSPRLRRIRSTLSTVGLAESTLATFCSALHTPQSHHMCVLPAPCPKTTVMLQLLQSLGQGLGLQQHAGDAAVKRDAHTTLRRAQRRVAAVLSAPDGQFLDLLAAQLSAGVPRQRQSTCNFAPASAWLTTPAPAPTPAPATRRSAVASGTTTGTSVRVMDVWHTQTLVSADGKSAVAPRPAPSRRRLFVPAAASSGASRKRPPPSARSLPSTPSASWREPDAKHQRQVPPQRMHVLVVHHDFLHRCPVLAWALQQYESSSGLRFAVEPCPKFVAPLDVAVAPDVALCFVNVQDALSAHVRLADRIRAVGALYSNVVVFLHDGGGSTSDPDDHIRLQQWLLGHRDALVHGGALVCMSVDHTDVGGAVVKVLQQAGVADTGKYS